MEPAVKDPALVEALAEILDVYVLCGMSRDFQRLMDTRALMVPDGSRPPRLAEALPPTSGPPPNPIAQRRTDLSADDVVKRYLEWYIEPDDVGNGVSGVEAFLVRYPLLRYAIERSRATTRRT